MMTPLDAAWLFLKGEFGDLDDKKVADAELARFKAVQEEDARRRQMEQMEDPDAITEQDRLAAQIAAAKKELEALRLKNARLTGTPPPEEEPRPPPPEGVPSE